MTGDTLEEPIPGVRSLNDRGILVTLDHLGGECHARTCASARFPVFLTSTLDGNDEHAIALQPESKPPNPTRQRHGALGDWSSVQPCFPIRFHASPGKPWIEPELKVTNHWPLSSQIKKRASQTDGTVQHNLAIHLACMPSVAARRSHDAPAGALPRLGLTFVLARPSWINYLYYHFVAFLTRPTVRFAAWATTSLPGI